MKNELKANFEKRYHFWISHVNVAILDDNPFCLFNLYIILLSMPAMPESALLINEYIAYFINIKSQDNDHGGCHISYGSYYSFIKLH